MSDDAKGEFQTFNLPGRLDAANSAAVEKQVLDIIDGGSRRLLLDLSGLTYISSAGLRALLAIAKRMKTAGGQLALCSLKTPIEEIFQISGYDTILDVHPNRDAAAARLQAR